MIILTWWVIKAEKNPNVSKAGETLVTLALSLKRSSQRSKEWAHNTWRRRSMVVVAASWDTIKTQAWCQTKFLLRCTNNLTKISTTLCKELLICIISRLTSPRRSPSTINIISSSNSTTNNTSNNTITSSSKLHPTITTILNNPILRLRSKLTPCHSEMSDFEEKRVNYLISSSQ